MDSIMYCNINQHKYEGYRTDFNNNNFENNFNVVMMGTSIKENYINSSYVYSDIDNQ